MSEDQAPEVPPRRKSLLPRLLGLAAVMLVVAVVVNLKDIRAIASGRKSLKQVLYGKNLMAVRRTFRFPEPLGPQDAKVKVAVHCDEGRDCHEPLVLLWMAVAQLEPERVRVEFTSPTAMLAQGKQTAEMSCEAEVLINGDRKLEVGEGKNKHVFYLTGPTPGPSHDMGPDSPGAPSAGHGWNFDDVAAVVNQYIKKQYKQDGNLTAAAIREGMTEAEKRIPRPDDTTDESGQGGEPKATSP